MIEALVLFASQVTQAAEVQAVDEIVFVTSIVVRVDSISKNDLRRANRYANCLSMPYFPIEREYDATKQRCLQFLKNRPSEDLIKVARSLENIVQQSPGSEASLSVERKEND